MHPAGRHVVLPRSDFLDCGFAFQTVPLFEISCSSSFSLFIPDSAQVPSSLPGFPQLPQAFGLFSMSSPHDIHISAFILIELYCI